MTFVHEKIITHLREKLVEELQDKIERASAQQEVYSYFIGFIDRLGGTLLEPGKTFEQMISEKRGFLEPLFIVFVFHVVVGALVGSFIAKLALSILAFLGPFLGGEVTGIILQIPVLITLLWLVCGLMLWVIFAGIAHLCARHVFKGVGSFAQLLKLYGYAYVPYFLVIIATMLLEANLFLFLGYSMILYITAILWMVLLMVVAVERSHRIDPGKAFISSLTGPLAISIILLATSGLLISWMGGLLGRLFA